MNQTINSLTELGWQVSPVKKTEYSPDNNLIQDSQVTFWRDKNEKLYSIMGHTNHKAISLWEGSTADNLNKLSDVKFNFTQGPAGDAFMGSCYPDGPRSRGMVWTNSLWIDPEDDMYYWFFHNETGWGAGDTAYTAHAQETGEPDFRHIGKMSSKDKGYSWDFDGWVITTNRVSWTEKYKPEPHLGQGQPIDNFSLGAGDFSVYINEKDGFFY